VNSYIFSISVYRDSLYASLTIALFGAVEGKPHELDLKALLCYFSSCYSCNMEVWKTQKASKNA